MIVIAYFLILSVGVHVFQDPPPGEDGMSWKKGDISIMSNCVLYDLDEKGKFKRIRITHFRNHPPETARFKLLVPKVAPVK